VSHAKRKLALVLATLGAAAGCNAILGNGYGVDDSVAANAADGGNVGDALVGGDALVESDGSSTGDGSTKLDGGSQDGAGCPNGVCPTLVAPAVGPQRLALSATSVYWSSLAGVAGLNIDGSNAREKKLAGPIAAAVERSVAVGSAGAVVYVTMPTTDRGATKCLPDLKVCSPDFLSNQGAASDVAADSTRVWISIYDEGAGTGEIWHTDLDGGTPLPNGMTTDRPIAFQIVGTNTFYRTSAAIKYAMIASAPVVAANLGGQTPLAFVVTGSTLVVATTNNELHACTLALPATCTAPVVGLTTNAVSAMTADGTHVYWVQAASGTVHRCDLAACATSQVLLAEGQASPNDIVLHDTSIYWANYGDAAGAGGSIMSLPK
jgi:hypothetical protein